MGEWDLRASTVVLDDPFGILASQRVACRWRGRCRRDRLPGRQVLQCDLAGRRAGRVERNRDLVAWRHARATVEADLSNGKPLVPCFIGHLAVLYVPVDTYMI